MHRALLLAALCAAPLAAGAQTYTGTLTSDDPRREYGGVYDAYTVDLAEGQQVTVRMESAEFDTYLVLRGPNGFEIANDDFEGTSVSQVQSVVPSAGVYTIWASGFTESALGVYDLVVTPGAVAQVERIEGRLDPRDEQLPKGEYADVYARSFDTAQPFTVELASFGFDGYLVVRAPDGQTWRNDDAGSASLSRLSDLPPMSGEWTVWVTTLGMEEVGAYDLRILTFD